MNVYMITEIHEVISFYEKELESYFDSNTSEKEKENILKKYKKEEFVHLLVVLTDNWNICKNLNMEELLIEMRKEIDID